MSDILIPNFGESITTATVAAWHKNAGDPVAKGDTLVTLETDKVSTGPGGGRKRRAGNPRPGRSGSSYPGLSWAISPPLTEPQPHRKRKRLPRRRNRRKP